MLLMTSQLPVEQGPSFWNKSPHIQRTYNFLGKRYMSQWNKEQVLWHHLQSGDKEEEKSQY